MTTERELESLKITCKLRDAEMEKVATSKAAGELRDRVAFIRWLSYICTTVWDYRKY